MRVPATVRWGGLALLGLLVAAGVSIAAGSLASQQIGLASEPISAGDALAPQAPPRSHRHREHRHAASPTRPSGTSSPVQAAPPPAAAPTPAVRPAPQANSGETGDEQDHAAGGGEPADD